MTLTASIPAATRARLPLVTYVLTAGTFLMGTSEFVVAGLLPGIAGDFATSLAHAGLSITVFAVGMIVGAPAMAALTLRLPRRLTLALALAVFAAGHVVVALTPVFAVLLAARFVTALATGAFWAVASVVAAQTAGPERSARALGVVLGGGMLANVLGVPLGAFSGQLIGWRGTFWALAALAAAAAVLVLRLVPAEVPGRAVPSLRREVRALGSGRLWLVLATCAMATGGVLSVYSYVSPLLTLRAGLDEGAVPGALMLFGAAALVGSLLGGRMGDGRPYMTLFATAATSLLAMLGLLAFSGTPLAALALFTLLGLAGLSANPVLVALAMRFGGEAPTLAAAMPTSIFNLGTAIGTGFAAVALEGMGPQGPVVVGVVGAVLLFVPLAALAFVDRRRDAA